METTAIAFYHCSKINNELPTADKADQQALKRLEGIHRLSISV